jgi:hypothetical protein
MKTARIKRGVRPYSGRRVTIIGPYHENNPDLLEVVLGSRKLSIAHYGNDIRTYRIDELEDFKEEERCPKCGKPVRNNKNNQLWHTVCDK